MNHNAIRVRPHWVSAYAAGIMTGGTIVSAIVFLVGR